MTTSRYQRLIEITEALPDDEAWRNLRANTDHIVREAATPDDSTEEAVAELYAQFPEYRPAIHLLQRFITLWCTPADGDEPNLDTFRAFMWLCDRMMTLRSRCVEDRSGIAKLAASIDGPDALEAFDIMWSTALHTHPLLANFRDDIATADNNKEEPA